MESPTDDLRRSIRGSYFWMFLGQIGSVGIILGIEFARGHLLSPQQVGLVVAATWLLGLMQVLAEFGLGAALVHRTGLTAAQRTAAGDAMILLSLALMLLALLLAPVVGWWNQDMRVAWLVAGAAPLCFLPAFSVVSLAVLQQRMQFRKIVSNEIASQAVQLTTLVVLGLYGLGAWALIIAMLARQAIRTVLMRLSAGSCMERPADWSEVPALFRFSAHLGGSRVLYFVYTDLDYLLLSRWWSPRDLGLYFTAFKGVQLPLGLLTKSLNQVAFPAFVRLRNDLQALRSHYLGVLRSMATLIFPVSVGIILVAPDAVWAIYGDRYLDAAPLLRLLAVSLTTRALQTLAPFLFVAQGKPEYNLKIAAIYSLMMIPAVLVGVQFGTVGVCWAWILVSSPLDLAIIALGVRRAGARIREALYVLAAPALRVGVMGAVVAVIGFALPRSAGETTAWIRVAAQVGAGGLVYGTLTWFAEPDWRKWLLQWLTRARA